MDYHLKPIGKTCAEGGEPLEPETVCYSVLVEREGGLLRLDFCEADWPGLPHDTIAQWRCQVPREGSSGPQPLDPDGLMRYFEQLAEDPGEDREKLRYVVALLLLQKRRLKLEGSRAVSGAEVLEFSGRLGEGTFEVTDCRLVPEEIERLQDQLNEQLQREWN